MHKLRRIFGTGVILAGLLAGQAALGAGKTAQGQPVEPYGVGVMPAVYLVNFLLLYISNPNEAANMPAYRTPVPEDLAGCLQENPLAPQECPYSGYANSFSDRLQDNRKCSLPPECGTNVDWERLAPGVAKRPEQINEPLGLERAKRVAEALNIDNSMILTDREYECTIGLPPRLGDRQTIYECITNLTNSTGNTNIPLSSYGLALNDAGDVQSLCAPAAPCLVFNSLFEGPLERIAGVCGWDDKLRQLQTETPLNQLISDGHQCQVLGGATNDGACLVESSCP